MNWDDELRSALCRQDPPRDLAALVRARLRASGPAPRRGWGWAAAVALVLVVILGGVGVQRWQMAQHQRHARADAQELVAALRLASSQLAAVRARVLRTP
ncbi:MAG: hypothetical protein ACRD1C_00485 [Terriglobales bacterium]